MILADQEPLSYFWGATFAFALIVFTAMLLVAIARAFVHIGLSVAHALTSSGEKRQSKEGFGFGLATAVLAFVLSFVPLSTTPGTIAMVITILSGKEPEAAGVGSGMAQAFITCSVLLVSFGYLLAVFHVTNEPRPEPRHVPSPYFADLDPEELEA